MLLITTALGAPTSMMARPVWEGDLSDDCTAQWHGLTLRAEKMTTGDWWWAVFDDADSEGWVASSSDHSPRRWSAGQARRAAEVAAEEHLKDQLAGPG